VQLVQRLTVVTSADGEVHASELEQMHRVAGALGIEAFVVDNTLKTAASPLD
jgi:tellurite resistance protein